MKKAAIVLVVLGASTLVRAGGLSKRYKNWDRTPEAYFLTSDERAQWKKVQSDADAQNFILDYKARRGPEWEKMLAERIAAADKYFSAGETKGSETLRGKVIIMFGPPSGVDSSKAKQKSTAGGDMNTSFTTNGQSTRDTPVATSSGGNGPLSYSTPRVHSATFTLQYDEKAAPKAIGKPFEIELQMISDSDQETWDPKDLDAKFEAVAEASIRKPESEQKDSEKKPADPSEPH